MSPYMGPAVDQTTNENGLWFNRQIGGNRRYYFSIDGLLGQTYGTPQTLIGAPGVNLPAINPKTGKPYAGGPTGTGQFIQGTTTTTSDTTTAVGPSRTLSSSAATGTGTGTATGIGTGTSTGTSTDTGAAATAIFKSRSLGADFPIDPFVGGLRGTWGWTNPDRTGLQLSGFWLNQADSHFFSGTGLDYNQADAIRFASQFYNQERLRALSGIPLAGADTDGDGNQGVYQPFDIFYKVNLESQLMGANLDWFSAPIYEHNSITVSPIAGARFLNIRERLAFSGADSGLGYTVQGPVATEGGTAAGTTTGTTTGTTSATTQTTADPFSPITINADPLVPNIMQSQLDSSTQSYLAGPEAGLRFDIGGDRLKLVAQSKVGLLANNSNRKLSGFNIGDAYYVPPLRTTPVMPGIDSLRPTLADPRDTPAIREATKFSSTDSTTYLSVMFEQSIMAKAPLLQFVPILNKMSVFRAAEFQTGYTVIVVGDVQRAANTIDWQAYPVKPQLLDKRSSYVEGIYNFGVEWTY
jgi:hypothetical protein